MQNRSHNLKTQLWIKLIVFILFLSIIFPVIGLSAVESKLLNKLQEKQAQEIFSVIRCMSCQGESIKESSSSFSIVMRSVIRDQIQQGKSKEQIINYIKSIYGEFAIFEPELNSSTYILWFAPLLVILGGSAFLFYIQKFKVTKLANK